MSTPEGLIVNACLEYLHLRGIFSWRNNSGAATIKGSRGSDRFIRFGKVGSSDIIGVMPDGRFLAIECKTARGKLSTPQEDFLSSVLKRGGVAFVARSVEDVKEKIEVLIR